MVRVGGRGYGEWGGAMARKDGRGGSGEWCKEQGQQDVFN